MLCDDNVGGKIPYLLGLPLDAQRKIGHRPALFAEEMSVVGQVRTVSRRLAVVVHMFNKAALRQCLETVVNCRQRNGRHLRFDAHKDFYRRGMVAPGHKRIVNVPPLLGETKPLLGDRLIVRFGFSFVAHYKEKETMHWPPYQELF